MPTVIVAFLSPKQDNKVGVAVTVAFIGVGMVNVTSSDTIHPPASLTLTVYIPADKSLKIPLGE
ncbi:MAG: hypothetical protein TRG1_2293 [Flavobacteriaceae bacterium FS1-H7996/R]|nr:MAG: hypothetical protein TRG1_2293 [Flavobacteriaceae bacterium FS1-H7996/R]